MNFSLFVGDVKRLWSIVILGNLFAQIFQINKQMNDTWIRELSGDEGFSFSCKLFISNEWKRLEAKTMRIWTTKKDLNFT